MSTRIIMFKHPHDMCLEELYGQLTLVNTFYVACMLTSTLGLALILLAPMSGLSVIATVAFLTFLDSWTYGRVRFLLSEFPRGRL